MTNTFEQYWARVYGEVPVRPELTLATVRDPDTMEQLRLAVLYEVLRRSWGMPWLEVN